MRPRNVLFIACFIRILLTSLFSIFLLNTVNTQQLGDTSQFFTITDPAYHLGEGPVVFIDGAHQNFHLLNGRFAPFARVLTADGYQVSSQDEPIDRTILSACEVYVIANPIHLSNAESWGSPNPSAFSEAEILALQSWVAAGGSLFLIADHMPFGGAAKDLAAAFEVEWLDCFAMDNRRRNLDVFTRKKGNLQEHPLCEDIDTVVSFTGSAFQAPATGQAILTLSDDFTLLLPEESWAFDDETPYLSGEGWQQLATMPYGKGKLVLSGEAAMFTAQIAGRNRRIGMNHPRAAQNIVLLRRLLGWLAE